MLLEKYSVLLPDTVVVVECRETEKKASNLFDLRRAEDQTREQVFVFAFVGDLQKMEPVQSVIAL